MLVRDDDRTVGEYDLGFEKTARAAAEPFGEHPVPSSKNKAPGTDGSTPAPLHESTLAIRHLFVHIQPDRSPFDRNRRDTRTRTTGRNELFMRRQLPHLVRPDQERIRRVRSTEIVVTGPFYDQPYPVFSSEVDRRDDIGR